MRISFIKLLPVLFAVIIQSAVFGQSYEYSVAGKVTDANSNPLAGATVKIKDTYTGAITNSQGEYLIRSTGQVTLTLEVSYVGFTTQTRKLKLLANVENESFILLQGTVMAKDFVVTANKANDKTPMAVQNLDSSYLSDNNLGQDLSIVMEHATSVVSTSDAGNGVGYTAMRIRGSDATRVNVTINGIPLNNPESQGTFFVNLPDLASSVNDIQIQRGVGTSTNGAASFGGSININTTELQKDAYGKYAFGMGSFGTLKNTLAFGTGLTKTGFAFDGRLSLISSDGYIDRASSDLKSYYLKGGYYGKKFSAKLITFGGNERTYQAWNGVPLDSINDESGRKYNTYDYADQVDDYTQTHYQLHLNYIINSNWKANVSGFYILGKGFYEQYKGTQYNGGGREEFADYGLQNVIIGDSTFSETNLVRRRWLDNTFAGGIFNFNYSKDKLNVVIGGGYNQYEGMHYGEIIWAEYASGMDKDQRYYDNKGIKKDFNIYTKATYAITNDLQVYGDIQYRSIDYLVTGIDNDQRALNIDTTLQFINPKAGLTYEINNESRVYTSFALANHEPNRSDYIDAAPGVTPLPETMYDYELGYKYAKSKFSVMANAYYMNYIDQLVLTGAINDVGGAVRQNVKSSYRAGLELEVGYRITKELTWSVNGTFSQNKIKEYTQLVDNWSPPYAQSEYKLENTDIAFSPSIIAGSLISYKRPLFTKTDQVGIALITKYVGEQYFDNTQNDERKLDGYLTNDIRLTYVISNIGINTLSFNFTAKNILNSLYVNNAWSYTFESPGYDPSASDIYVNKSSKADSYNMAGYFPQAGKNFLLGLTLDF